MPSLKLERMLVTLVILTFIQLQGCEVDRMRDDYSPSSPAEKPAESHAGWPSGEASSSVSSSSAEVAAVDPPAEIQELCRTIPEFLASLPGAETRRSSGQGNDCLSGEHQSCFRFQAFGRFSALKGDDPTGLVRNKFKAMGWEEELRFAADGPDGTSFAFRKGQTFCQFQGAWDGGDDSDPGYEPSDEYKISGSCETFRVDGPIPMQHRRP